MKRSKKADIEAKKYISHGVGRYSAPISEKSYFRGRYGNPIFREENLTDNSLYNDFDTQGSYTGVPEDGGKPIQDADDL